MAYEMAGTFVSDKRNIVVNMVGLETGPIKEISDAAATVFYLHASIPLLLRTYLDIVCKELSGRSLYNKAETRGQTHVCSS